MSKTILFVRTVPYEFDAASYNVQGFGLGKAFCKLGYDFDFLCFSKKGRSEYILFETNGHRIKVITKPRFRWLRTGICPEIINSSFLQQYEFVISCEYSQYMTYAMSKVSDNVVMYSGPYYNMFFVPFSSVFYDILFTKKMNRNIKHKFVKSVLAKEFLESKGYTGVESIGVALDCASFECNVDLQPGTQKVVEYMRNNCCLLYVGALIDRKNFPFLLAVYQQLLVSNPDIKLVIIGKGDSDYVNKHMKRIPKDVRSGIYSVARMENTQLQFIYPLAKVFLLPSKLEIFGMVLLEAMYFGAPVVTSWNGGSSTLIDGKQTGQIVKEFDVNKWIHAIQKYLNSSSYRENVIRNARELIVREYNWDSLAKKMLDIISI